MFTRSCFTVITMKFGKSNSIIKPSVNVEYKYGHLYILPIDSESLAKWDVRLGAQGAHVNSDTSGQNWYIQADEFHAPHTFKKLFKHVFEVPYAVRCKAKCLSVSNMVLFTNVREPNVLDLNPRRHLLQPDLPNKH